MIRRNLSEKRRRRIIKQMAAVTMAVTMTVSQCAVGVADISSANVESSEELDKADELSEGNYTYTVNTDGTVTVTKYNGEEENITVPDEIGDKTVSSIGRECFKGNNNIKTVKLPDAITGIEYSAFEDCTNMTDIDLPEGLESLRRIFKNCTSLKEIYIPKM